MGKAEQYIEQLKMERHPEGGFFSPAFSSDEVIPVTQLPQRYLTPRALYSSIFYLLEHDDLCRLHRLQTDEVWHFYDGGVLRLHLFASGYDWVDLGRSQEANKLQYRVQRGVDFGAEIIEGDFVLVGCTLSPAFSFEDHSWSNAKDLVENFPDEQKLIERLIKEST